MLLSLYSILIFCYIISAFVSYSVLDYVTGLFAIFCFLYAFRDAARLYQITGGLFVTIGIGAALYSGLPLAQLPYHATSTVVLLLMFYVLPFINSIIVVGRYDQSVNRLLKTRVNHLGHLYWRSSLVSFVLGSFLNLATISFVEEVLRKNLRAVNERVKKKFIAQSLLRGYSLSLAWSPMEILVAISVDITHRSFLHYLPWLLLFAVVLLVSDWILGLRYRQYPMPEADQQQEVSVGAATIRRIFVLFGYLAVFITLILLLRHLLQTSFLLTVGLVIVPYSLAWAMLIRRLRSYLLYSLWRWRQQVNQTQSYIVLFLAVGFFMSILQQTSFLNYLQAPFSALGETPLLFFMTIQVLFLGLAMIGFHPLLTISVLAEVVQPLLASINPLSIGIVLISSGLATVVSGTYNVTVSLMSRLLAENPYKISYWNLGFALLYSSTGTLIAYLLL